MNIRRILLSPLLSMLFLSGGLLAAGGEELSQKALEAYHHSDFDRSAQLFVEAIAQGEKKIDTFYNAACSFARAGKPDEAFKYLELALSRGYYNKEHLTKDPDLTGLHSDARWEKVLERCDRNYKELGTFWETPALDTPFRENLTDSEKIAGLSKLWAEARYNFINFDKVPDLDWNALYLSTIPRALETKSTLEYFRVLMTFYAELKDGHTKVDPPKELRDQLMAAPLIRTALLEEKVVVTHVIDEALRGQGLEPGQEVVAVGGVPVRQYAEERVKPWMTASTPQDLEARMYDYFLFSGPISEPVELTLRDRKGREFKASMPRVAFRERWNRGRPKEVMEHRMLPGNIAYVALNSFDTNRKVVTLFQEAFPTLAGAAALILDIRENGGGNSAEGDAILGHLIDHKVVSTTWRTRNYRPTFRAWKNPEDGYYFGEMSVGPVRDVKPFAGPVVLLISPRTYSAAEDFAVGFQAAKRGLVIGEPTGGSTGQPVFFKLPGGGTAQVCSKRDTYPDGREFIAVGIQPDRLVRPTIAELRAGRDGQLEAAIAELKRLLKK